MMHFFEKRDPWGNGMALWVVVAMAFLVPLGWWSLRQIDLENDVENWLPTDDPQARILNWFSDHFETRDAILVSWEGSSLDDPRTQPFAEKLVGTRDEHGVLRGGLKQLNSAITPQDLIAEMTAHRVDRDEAVRRLHGVLVGIGPMKVRLTAAGREHPEAAQQALIAAAREQLQIELQVSPSALAVAESTDYGEEYDDELPAEGETPGKPFVRMRPHDFQVRWRGMHVQVDMAEKLSEVAAGLRGTPTRKSPEGELLIAECFSVPGAPIAMSVGLTEAGLADVEGTLDEIRRIAEECHIPADSLRMGGRAVAADELNVEVKKAGWNRDFPILQIHRRSVLLMSCLVGAGLAFLMLRSFRLATLVLIVALYSVFLTVALVPVTNGSMNMVLVVMPTLLLVLTISAAIHVANYWKHAAARDYRTAVVEAARMAREPCMWASFTTAIGLISLTTSPLAPVRDFGFYAAIGCVVSVIVVLFGMPALLLFWPGRPPKEEQVGSGRVWTGIGSVLCRYRTLVTVVSAAVLCVCLTGLQWFRTETKVIRYFPDETRVVQDYNFLEENLSGIVPVDVVIRFDETARRNRSFLERMELVRQVQDKIRTHPEISGTISLTDFQPKTAPPPADATFFQKARYNKRAHTMEERIKSEGGSKVSAFLAVADAPVRLEPQQGRYLDVEPGDELWRITAQVAIMSDLNYAQLTGDWENPLARPGDLNELAQSVLRFEPGASHTVTGMVPLFLRTQQAVLESLIVSFGLAFAVIAAVMMFLLRNPIAGLITMIPNILPVGVVFGLISWYGIAVDIGTMITASVALGIAVDGTLHLLTWFRAGLEQGETREQAIAKALRHCGPAMTQTSAAVGLGLLMLAPADLLLVSRFGWLMASLIGAALVADLIVLPALLAGPLGALIENTQASRARAAAAEAQREREAAFEAPPVLPQPHLPLGSPSHVGQTLR